LPIRSGGSPRAYATTLEGTIDATVEAPEGSCYGTLFRSWIRAPLAMNRMEASRASSGGFRAKDLIAELDIINGQIHRMMFQVERAVAHLATSG
jgi:hypothetical protein